MGEFDDGIGPRKRADKAAGAAWLFADFLAASMTLPLTLSLPFMNAIVPLSFPLTMSM